MQYIFITSDGNRLYKRKRDGSTNILWYDSRVHDQKIVNVFFFTFKIFTSELYCFCTQPRLSCQTQCSFILFVYLIFYFEIVISISRYDVRRHWLALVKKQKQNKIALRICVSLMFMDNTTRGYYLQPKRCRRPVFGLHL